MVETITIQVEAYAVLHTCEGCGTEMVCPVRKFPRILAPGAGKCSRCGMVYGYTDHLTPVLTPSDREGELRTLKRS